MVNNGWWWLLKILNCLIPTVTNHLGSHGGTTVVALCIATWGLGLAPEIVFIIPVIPGGRVGREGFQVQWLEGDVLPQLLPDFLDKKQMLILSSKITCFFDKENGVLPQLLKLKTRTSGSLLNVNIWRWTTKVHFRLKWWPGQANACFKRHVHNQKKHWISHKNPGEVSLAK